LFKSLPYDVERDFLPVTRVAEIINVMVVNPAPGAKTVKEFVEWAKKRSGEVRFGSSGAGQPDHLAGEFFQRLAGLRMMHVPYKGGGPALVDLVAGDLQVMFSTYVVAAPHVSTGRLRVLAVTTPQRQPLLPELPTVGETVPGFGVSNWTGVFVSSKTPRRIANRLFTEFNKAVLYPDVKTRQNLAGIDPVGSAAPEEFQKFVREDTRRWAGIIRDANIKVE
jgi:tripartite-type tricarboxylate transporter receptor subunit TctC